MTLKSSRSVMAMMEFQPPLILIWYPEKIGYPAACNAGIKEAKGESIVLLNDDTILLPQGTNDWLNILSAPFSDPKVAITGPWMMRKTPEIQQDFICFFCCMIRKSALDTIGLLDEVFGAGYAEDVDLCCRAVASGLRLVQVPNGWGGAIRRAIGIRHLPHLSRRQQYFQKLARWRRTPRQKPRNPP